MSSNSLMNPLTNDYFNRVTNIINNAKDGLSSLNTLLRTTSKSHLNCPAT